VNALKCLTIALFKDSEGSRPEARLYGRVKRALCYVIKKYFDQMCKGFETQMEDWDVLLDNIAGLALSVKQHLGCEQEIWYYICCKWLGQQEAYVVAQATQARRSDWVTKIQELTALLTSPDGAQFGDAKLPHVNLDTLFQKCSEADLAQGVYDREKTLFTLYKDEEVNVKFHVSKMMDYPNSSGDTEGVSQ